MLKPTALGQFVAFPFIGLGVVLMWTGLRLSWTGKWIIRKLATE